MISVRTDENKEHTDRDKWCDAECRSGLPPVPSCWPPKSIMLPLAALIDAERFASVRESERMYDGHYAASFGWRVLPRIRFS